MTKRCQMWIEMKCSVKGCPGEYEKRKIAHTIRFQGRVSIIDHVPAKVCSVCGDVLLGLETVEQIEAMMQKPAMPVKDVPLFEYGNKVDIEKRSSRQVSFWLPAGLVEDFQIQAVKDKKSNSQLLAEFIRMGLHEAEEKK